VAGAILREENMRQPHKVTPKTDVFLVIDGQQANGIFPMPNQLRTIIELIQENEPISEARFHGVITVARDSGRLKTKQDPWDIYRYYRAQLRQQRALREVQDPIYQMREMLNAQG
jgi:hypothetical protein